MIARLAASRDSSGPAQDEQALGVWEAAWARLVEQYSTAYTAVVAEVSRPSAGSSDAPFDPEGLWKLLERISRLEEEANRRLVQSQVLAGISKDDLEAAASSGTQPDTSGRGASPLLAEHCCSVLRSLAKRGNPAHVLSVSWSAHFVRSILSSCNRGKGECPAEA